jgi:hypothetical protein
LKHKRLRAGGILTFTFMVYQAHGGLTSARCFIPSRPPHAHHCRFYSISYSDFCTIRPVCIGFGYIIGVGKNGTMPSLRLATVSCARFCCCHVFGGFRGVGLLTTLNLACRQLYVIAQGPQLELNSTSSHNPSPTKTHVRHLRVPIYAPSCILSLNNTRYTFTWGNGCFNKSSLRNLFAELHHTATSELCVPALGKIPRTFEPSCINFAMCRYRVM